MVKELKTWIVVALLVFIVGALTAQYNLYAIHKLSHDQIELLAGEIDGGVFRLGGEEYEHYDWAELEKIRQFLDLTDSEVALLAPGDYQGFEIIYEALPSIQEVTFKNEIWFEIERWSEVRKDFWTYLFNKKRYYRKHALKYVREAFQFQDYMASKGHAIEIVLNVPLPQNGFLSAMLDEISKNYSGKVDVHIYGKMENNYHDKLNGWLQDIKRKFGAVMIGEYSGIDLRAYPNLKNSMIHKDMNDDIRSILQANGITEVYDFTLCMPKSAENWQNAPIYHKFTVGTEVIDNLYNLN